MVELPHRSPLFILTHNHNQKPEHLKETLTPANMNATVAVPQDSSLLALPPELRNMIYSFALTTDEPVICVPYQKDGQLKQRLQIRQDNNKPTKDLNQMKFVCR